MTQLNEKLILLNIICAFAPDDFQFLVRVVDLWSNINTGNIHFNVTGV